MGANDEVVEDLNIEKGSRFDDFAGDGGVFGGRGRVAAGMIVGEDDAGGVLANSVAKEFADADDGGVDGPLIHARARQDLILGVEQERAHFFLLEQRHVGKEARGVGGRRDARFLFGGRVGDAAAEFETGVEFDGFDGTDALDGGELEEGDAGETREAAAVLQHLRGKIHDVDAFVPGAEEDGDEFGIAHDARAEMQEPFARALVVLHGLNGVGGMFARFTRGAGHIFVSAST